MTDREESTNGYDKRLRALAEEVATIKAQRQTVPISIMLSWLGLFGSLVVMGLRELDKLDERLQREARDLDHTLNVQIAHTDEKFEAHVDRVVTFIESFKAWQISHTDFSATSLADHNARLRALEKQNP